MREKLAIKNGSITLLCQVLDIIIGFVVRKFFIFYLGVGVLGINGTFISLLSSLSLAELGFESAVIYSLYKPIQDNDREMIEKIISVLKKIYGVVAFFILFGGMAISLMLPKLITDVELTKEIYISFYFFVVGNAVTYLMAYKRTFLLAQQKDYIRNLFVSLFKLCATVVQILLLIAFKRYLYYIIVIVFQNLLTNIAISVYVDKEYNFDFNKKFDKEIFKKIFKDVKNIFFGKIAGYIYSSTDNIIISSLVSTVSVGLLGNYTQILYQMKNVINNAFNSTRPIIGHFLTEDKDDNHSFRVLNNYTFIRFVFSSIAFIPGFVLCDCFISLWIGDEYVLPSLITLLLVSDIYVHFVHGTLVDYIFGIGYFGEERNISIVGAFLNLSISLGTVKFLGIYGVLLGTVISQWFFWISRSLIIFIKYYSNTSFLREYWHKCIKYTGIFYVDCGLCRYFFSMIHYKSMLINFLAGGIFSEVIVCLTIVLFNYRTSEMLYVKSLLKKYLSRICAR